VEDQPEVAVETEGDPLADPPEPPDGAALYVANRRHCRLDQRRADHPDPLDGPADDAPVQGMEIELDVGELGHAASPDLASPQPGGGRGHHRLCRTSHLSIGRRALQG
jgi:hypothetical protein